jgi:Protein of unknown function (DUF4012)
MDTPTQAPSPPRHRRRWLRRTLWVLVGAAVVLGVLVALTAIAALGVKTDLDAGRTQLKEGRRDLSHDDMGGAAAAFRQAEGTFAGAQQRAAGGLSSIMRSVPILGRNLDVVSGTAVAGRELAAAGADLAAAVDGLPDGLRSLTPEDGRLPVLAIASLFSRVDSADQHAQNAQAAIDATPSTLLVGPVAAARVDAEQQVTEAATTLRAASLLLNAFPSFVGVDGPKHYLLVAQSPAELRGTGGIWGAYAVLTADRGTISVSPFHGALTLSQRPPDSIPAPNPDYRRNYDSLGGAGSFRDLNMTPDFPSAARAALGLYRVDTGQTLDGVISADPFALQSLFHVTGPQRIPSLGITIDAGNVVDYTTNRAYIDFARRGKARKEILGAVAGAAFQRFVTEHGRALARLKAVGGAASGGHLTVYTTDPAFEEGLRVAGLDGALWAPSGDDLLSVVINSLSGSKIDYYVTRTVDYDVQLGGDGQAVGTTTVTLRNDAPSSGIPGFVIIPATKGYHPGDAVPLLTTSCPGPCTLVSAQRNDKSVSMRVGSELGYPWYQSFFTVPSRTTGTLKVVTSRTNVWTGNSSGGSYRLRILPQTTVKPTEVSIAIHAPAGTHVTWSSEPMTLDGSTATWQGTPTAPLTLEVRFGAPVPLSWWRNLSRHL